MSNSDVIFKVETVSVQPLLSDITKLEVDALVAPCGTSSTQAMTELANWVRSVDADRAIAEQLARLKPLGLGDVVITTAGPLKCARYMFHAVIFDTFDDHASGNIEDELVATAARKCIAVATALGLKTVAFTPWGTGVRAADPARVTALMVQAIAAQVQVASGSLEMVYLVSNRQDHYQWFVDRTFVFRIVLDQLAQVSDAIKSLDIPDSVRGKIVTALQNAQRNVVVYNEIFGGAKYNVSVEQGKGIVVGDQASASLTEASAKP